MKFTHKFQKYYILEQKNVMKVTDQEDSVIFEIREEEISFLSE